MKWERLLEITRQVSLIESQALAAFGEDPRALAVQLGRWVRAGKLLQLRRGLYVPAARFRYRDPPLERVANFLVSPSYVSLERALSLHGMIPEGVPLVQSVTVGRPGLRENPLGRFQYRHVKGDWFFGYSEVSLGEESALVATPEKALLDLFYLSKGEHTRERIEALRLQETHRLDLRALREMAVRSGSPRVQRAAERACSWVLEDSQGWREV